MRTMSRKYRFKRNHIGRFIGRFKRNHIGRFKRNHIGRFKRYHIITLYLNQYSRFRCEYHNIFQSILNIRLWILTIPLQRLNGQSPSTLCNSSDNKSENSGLFRLLWWALRPKSHSNRAILLNKFGIQYYVQSKGYCTSYNRRNSGILSQDEVLIQFGIAFSDKLFSGFRTNYKTTLIVKTNCYQCKTLANPNPESIRFPWFW